MSKGKRSLTAIAEIIGAEGFSDYAANAVKKYWRTKTITPHSKKRVENIRKAFGEVTAKMTAGERLILGKYIAVLSAEQFDTGLRLGLMTLVSDLADELAFIDPK